MEGNKCGHSGPTETFATSPGDEVNGRGGVFVDSNYSIDAKSGPVEGPGEESAHTGTSTVKLEESSRVWHRPAGESTIKNLNANGPDGQNSVALEKGSERRAEGQLNATPKGGKGNRKLAVPKPMPPKSKEFCQDGEHRLMFAEGMQLYCTVCNWRPTTR